MTMFAVFTPITIAHPEPLSDGTPIPVAELHVLTRYLEVAIRILRHIGRRCGLNAPPSTVREDPGVLRPAVVQGHLISAAASEHRRV
jgi:hypothetical protein